MVLSTRQRGKYRAGLKQHNQQLVDLPLDILFEIFLLLEPLDLLYLSRTTKGLRKFLLNPKKSPALWKNAIGNVDMPPCPDFMSAPAYTYLAFDPVCHGCGCTCETIEWELRMRCCPDCLQEIMHNLESVDLPYASQHYEISDYPGSDIRVKTTVFPMRLSPLDWKVATGRKRPRKLSVGQYLDRENAFWKPIWMHADLFRDWEYERLKEKANQLSLVRDQRTQDIKRKLGELGWTDVVSTINDSALGFSKLPQVRKLEPLTPTEWTEIRPQLITWARKIRKEMRWNSCLNTLTSVSQDILRDLSSDTSLKAKPRLIDIAMLPAVYLVLKSSANSECQQEDLKKKLHHMLPPAIKKWSSDAVKELEQLAREQSDLPLHSVIFRCTGCSHRGWRPPGQERLALGEASSHIHLYKQRHNNKGAEDHRFDEMSPYDRFIMTCETHARSIQVLRVDVGASGRVNNLIRRMGRNPARVTFDELRRSTVKVVCSLCPQQVVETMSFEQAFNHCLSFHLRSKKTEVWSRVSARSENATTSSAKLSSTFNG